MSEKNEKNFQKFCVREDLSPFFDLISQKKDKFELYFRNLISWNEKFNLTAITEHDEVFEKHFLDSILSEQFIPKNSTVIDIGAGAGFPSFPLKIVRDDLKIVAVDSVNKKVSFLNDISINLNFKNVSCLHERAEDLAQKSDFREKFDVCVARAVASLPTLCELCLPHVKAGGYFVAMKGKDAQDEIKLSDNALKQLGGRIESVTDSGISGLSHANIVIKKLSETNKKYPRKAGMPSKKPL